MKFKLLIFIFVQSVLTDSLPKNGKYAFAYTWSWTTVPTGDKGQTNLDSQIPKIQNENYILKRVDPEVNQPIDHRSSGSDTIINDPNYQQLLDFQQRYIKVVQSPENQNQQPVRDNLYYTPTNTVILPQDQRIQSDDVAAQRTYWYPVVQPYHNDLNTPIHTGTIVYPNQNTGTQNSIVQSSNTPTIAYAASSVVIPQNLKTFLQNPFAYVNSVAYTQV